MRGSAAWVAVLGVIELSCLIGVMGMLGWLNLFGVVGLIGLVVLEVVASQPPNLKGCLGSFFGTLLTQAQQSEDAWVFFGSMHGPFFGTW